MNLINVDTIDTYCVGDIHGDFNSISGNIKRYELSDCNMIFCGDIGFGFERPAHYKPILNKLEKLCSERNVHCFFIRGNHDDPSYFDGIRINYPHIIAVKDYTVLNIGNVYNVLCVGGAISIDRTYRLAMINNEVNNYLKHHKTISNKDYDYVHRGYWSNEMPVYDESILSELSNINIDFVCTHTCPDFCEPTTKDGISYWMIKDKDLDADTSNERKVMTDIKDYLNNSGKELKKWVYGHFHYHHVETIDNITYIMLDMCRNGNFDMCKLI